MERKWHLRQVSTLPASLLKAADKNPIVAAYLQDRGITTHEEARQYLEPDSKNLTDPFEFPDMEKAVKRIQLALDSGEIIGIWGDFDVDGQTSTALLVECLEKLGASVQYHLPVRGKETHGISLSSLQSFMGTGIQLLITCDTGISEHESVAYATRNGLDVIITDHHSLPIELPKALACINPHFLPQGHPLGTLSGSGVAFELMLAVCRGQNRENVALASLDLAAIGVIADMAPLKKDARLISQLGLAQLSTQPRKWVQLLMEHAKITSTTVDESTIGYAIAPRLNAAGRLEDANPLVEFILDRKPDTLDAMAQHLEELNANRKWLCDQVYQSASQQLERQREIAADPVIILTNTTWPGGVLGLAAGWLKDRFYRPVILLNDSGDGVLRGSARSVEGVNITEAISSVSSMLLGFGGHTMAAGLSFPIEKLPDVRRDLNKWMRERGLAVTEPPPLEIDAELTLPQITRQFFQSIQKLAPFGMENPPMVFCCRRVEVTSVKPLDRNREHFKLQIQDEQGESILLYWWNADETLIPTGLFDLAFSLRESTYKGKTTLQAEYIDIHPIVEPDITIGSAGLQEVLDFRNFDEPLLEAKKIFAEKSCLVFQEPTDMDDPLSVGRNQIHPVENLILASIPPSQSLLKEILQQASPTSILLAFHIPAEKNLPMFLNHLAGLIQYALKNHEGLTSTRDLARAMNLREETISTGIEWFQADGKIRVLTADHDLTRFERYPAAVKSKVKASLETRLRFQLQETASYQNFIYNQPVDFFKKQL